MVISGALDILGEFGSNFSFDTSLMVLSNQLCKRTPGLISVREGRLPDGSDTCLPALATNATTDASVLPITGWGEQCWVDREAWHAVVHGVAKSGIRLSD